MESMENKVIKRELPCKLTDGEMLNYSKLLAKEGEDKVEAENRKRDTASEYTAVINGHTTTIAILSR